MLKDKAPELLTGEVEIDESYYGGLAKNKHASKRGKNDTGRSLISKTPIFGILKRGGDVYATPVSNVDSKTLIPIMVDRVEEGATIYTDEHKPYRKLKGLYNHAVVKHGNGQYVNGVVHTNTIEGFWSQLKRGINGIYHHVTPTHLHRYCFEYSYRYNTRKITDVERFNNVLAKCEGRLKWDELTGKNPEA